MKTKKCSKCGEIKNVDEFCKKKSNIDGLQCYCKKCTKEYLKEYYNNNAEKLKAKVKQWNENNQEKLKEYNKQYRENNPEKIKARYKQWNDNNPGKVKAKNKKWVGNLTDCYVAARIGLHVADCPTELIELKRAQLKLHREIVKISS